MATTVSGIADKAIASVKASITDAFITVSLIDPSVEVAWDTTTGDHYRGEATLGTLDMVVVNDRPIKNVFPEYVAGPDENLVFLSGDFAPKVGSQLRGPKTYTIMAVQDILDNGSMFFAVVR